MKVTINQPDCVDVVKSEIAKSLIAPGSDITLLERVDAYITAGLPSHARKVLVELKMKIAKAAFQEVQPYEFPLILDNDTKNYKIKKRNNLSNNYFGYDYKRFFRTVYKLRQISNLRVDIPVGIALKINELTGISLKKNENRHNYRDFDGSYSLFQGFFAFAPAECFHKDGPQDPLLLGVIDPISTDDRYSDKIARNTERKFYLIGRWS